MHRAAMTALLAMAMSIGCDAINGIPGPAYQPPPEPSHKCDAGEVQTLPPPPQNSRCVPVDAGTD